MICVTTVRCQLDYLQTIELFFNKCRVLEILLCYNWILMLFPTGAICGKWPWTFPNTRQRGFRVTKTRAHPRIIFTGNSLLPDTSNNYLGVFITLNLSWNEHVTHIIAKANRTLGYLKQNCFMAPADLTLFFSNHLFVQSFNTLPQYGTPILNL